MDSLFYIQCLPNFPPFPLPKAPAALKPLYPTIAGTRCLADNLSDLRAQVGYETFYYLKFFIIIYYYNLLFIILLNIYYFIK